ncbi:MAG: ribosome silencing factor [Burkholderiaceae bacterium]|jgi:ribosome-associated protein|nr:ribosome silencing factor [Burkholderiaceae bacterium]
MDIRKLQRAIVDGLEDVKAQDIVVFNTEHLSPLFERVIIATGSSNRQTKALASGVRESVKAAGFPVLATEGGDNGEWIIVDCGAAVAHVMQPAIREYYRLEEIWGGKPVKMKLGAAKTGLVKASEPDDDEAPAMAPERKAAARKAAAPAKQGPARAAKAQKVAVQPAVVAKKAPAKKAPARKTAGQPAVRTTNAERAAAAAAAIAAKAAEAQAAAAKSGRKSAARKTAAGKTAAPAGPKVKTIVVKPVARKTAAVKTAAGRAPAKKAAARKTPARRG